MGFVQKNIVGIFGSLWLVVGFFSITHVKNSPSVRRTTDEEIRINLIDSDGGDYEKKVKAFFKDRPVLVDIARCESNFTHLNPDGSILRGRKNPRDVGIMQINQDWHDARSIKLGFNIMNLEDNMAYAKYLYDHEGPQPWKSSSDCWRRLKVNPHRGMSGR